ncbi:MAG: mannose-6-phosphate isomerase, class I, partial [Bifidobacteriaceae bacterium]|nr:mannose-6-phosphate isomerase, class I [Bifidobacteriaceae bacterium]
MFRLDHVVRDYPWGSAEQIPRFLGLTPGGGPVAEIWLGGHRVGSATVARGEDDAGVALRDIIARNPVEACGPGAGKELPFLLKLLGVATPLSLQVHPGAEQSRAGYAREEAAGIGLDAPNRTYKDPNPKAELVYALESFDVLAGFKAPNAVRRSLEPLAVGSALAQAMIRGLAAGGLRQALSEALVGEAATEDGVLELTAACRRQLASPGEDPGPSATLVALARRFPGDPALAAVLMMNHVSLAPGESLFVAPGTLHSYLRGLAVEVMTASDNVLRAGLTTKYADRERVVETVDDAGKGLSRATVTKHDGVRLLRPPAGRFQLADARVEGSTRLALTGPRV